MGYIKIRCQNNPDFYKEDVIFELKSDTFSVQGLYFMKTNQPNTNITLLYPFPSDSLMFEPVIEKAFDMTHNADLIIRNKTKGNILFQVNFDSTKETLFLIRYYQILKSDEAQYILLSTKSWGKPLNQADYKLIVPKRMHINSFSYPPDKEFNINDKRVYVWQKENFMPDRDFIFKFKN